MFFFFPYAFFQVSHVSTACEYYNAGGKDVASEEWAISQVGNSFWNCHKSSSISIDKPIAVIWNCSQTAANRK
jgi:hypothetical protein